MERSKTFALAPTQQRQQKKKPADAPVFLQRQDNTKPDSKKRHSPVHKLDSMASMLSMPDEYLEMLRNSADSRLSNIQELPGEMTMTRCQTISPRSPRDKKLNKGFSNVIEGTGEEEKKETPIINEHESQNVHRFWTVLYPECGTKRLFSYSVGDGLVHRYDVDSTFAFTSCYAFVQTPANRLFVTGGIGGDETERRTREIVLGQDGVYRSEERESLVFRRVDHSLCYLGENSLFATGSYLREDDLCQSCERYDVIKDRWAEYPPLIVGRSSHSSCGFEGRFVFVFCGVAITKREYKIPDVEANNGSTIIKEEIRWNLSNTIERLDAFKKFQGWASFTVPNSPLTPRKHPAVLQVESDVILIFGGFATDKSFKASYHFNIVDCTIVKVSDSTASKGPSLNLRQRPAMLTMLGTLVAGSHPTTGIFERPAEKGPFVQIMDYATDYERASRSHQRPQ